MSRPALALLALLGLAVAVPAAADEQECVSCWTSKCRNLKDFGMPACKAAPVPATPPAGPGRRKDAKLSVETVPGGLVVLVDERPIGTSPLYGRSVSPGDHQVSVQADACHTATPQWVFLSAGEERSVSITAQNATATIEIQATDGSRPSGRLEVDGTYAGYAPGPVTVSACARELHLTTGDGRSAWAYLSLTAGARATVKVTLPTATGPATPPTTSSYTPPPQVPQAPYNPPPTQSPVDVLESGCRGGSAKSCNALGLMYMDGDGVPQDYSKAAGALETACNGGELAACTDLGSLYADGNGVSKDIDRAKELFEKACDGGYKRGCNAKEALVEPQPDPDPPSSGGFCSTFDFDDLFDGGSHREHIHPVFGWGFATTLEKGARQYTLAALIDIPRENVFQLLRISYENAAFGDNRQDAPEALGSVGNWAIGQDAGASFGPWFFSFGWELDHASEELTFLKTPDESLKSDLAEKTPGWAVGGRLATGFTMPLGPVHVLTMASYRGIYGPLQGGLFIDLYVTPEYWNCAD